MGGGEKRAEGGGEGSGGSRRSLVGGHLRVQKVLDMEMRDVEEGGLERGGVGVS